MGGISLDALGPWNGYKCPWCPLAVMVADSEAEARRYMESHLDGHMAQPIGRPRPEVAA